MSVTQLDLLAEASEPAPLAPLPKPSRRRGEPGWREVYDRILARMDGNAFTRRPEYTPEQVHDKLLGGEGQRSSISNRLKELAEGEDPWLVVDKTSIPFRYRLAPGKQP